MPHPYARAGPSRIIGSPSLGSIQRAHRTLSFPLIATSGARPDMASIDKFNEHCWKDVIPEADLELYAGWRRETFVGPRPALLAIDLYDLVYRGGPHSPNELNARYPNSCGIFAHRTIAPTKRLSPPRAGPASRSSIAPRRPARRTGRRGRSPPGGRSTFRPTATPSITNSHRNRRTSSSPSSVPASSRARRCPHISRCSAFKV
jgi:hypothetical protein